MVDTQRIAGPDLNAGLDKIGDPVATPTYLVRCEAYLNLFTKLEHAAACWQRVHGSELVCLLGSDGKAVESLFDGETWSEWK